MIQRLNSGLVDALAHGMESCVPCGTQQSAQFQRKSVTKQLLELYALLLKSAASVRID
jgi:hypothetical protein